jgi:hypothetical protein
VSLGELWRPDTAGPALVACLEGAMQENYRFFPSFRFDTCVRGLSSFLSFLFHIHKHTNTHTHICTRTTRTHTRTRTHTHTLAHTRTHLHIHTPARTHATLAHSNSDVLVLRNHADAPRQRLETRAAAADAATARVVLACAPGPRCVS